MTSLEVLTSSDTLASLPASELASEPWSSLLHASNTEARMRKRDIAGASA